MSTPPPIVMPQVGVVDRSRPLPVRLGRDGVITRVALTLTACTLLLILPLGPARIPLAGLVLATQAIASFAVWRLRLSNALQFRLLLTVEHCLALTCALVAPDVYVATSLLIVGSLGANSPFLDRRWQGWIAGVTFAGLVVPPLVRDISEAAPVIGIGMMMLVHIVANRSGRVVLAEEAARSAQHQADHDPLTGLANRRLIRQALAKLSREDRVGLLLFDLDNFKEVNDTLGHDFGDDVLRSLAQRLERIDPTVLVARLGGDEFAAMVPGSPDQTQRFAERVEQSWSTPTKIDGVEIVARSSIGMVHTSWVDPERLLRSADVAMYRSKREGLGASWYRTADDPYSARRLQLVQELPVAIAEGALDIWFQPQVDLRSGRTVGGEAVVRWRHPAWGLVGAEEILQYVGLAGRERAFTAEVLRQSLEKASGWHDHLGLSVNVTLSDAGRSAFVDQLEQRLSATGFAPSRLTLEIVEDDRDVAPERLVESVGRIRSLGVRVSLDDFGQAASSLARLDLFDVDELKIDRRFISRLLHERRAAAIVDSVVSLAARLDLRVVAEGVETIDEAHAVAETGIEVVQGFYFARPGERLHATTYPAVLPMLGDTTATVAAL